MKAVWVIRRVRHDLHVVPPRDLRRHLKSRRCWCGPRFQDKYEDVAGIDDRRPLVVMHNALDGRE